MRRLFSGILAFCFVLTLPLSALAVEVDLTLGNVSVNDTQVKHITADGEKTENHNGSVTVTQSGTQTTNYSVTVNTGTDLAITLSNVKCTTGGSAPVDITVTGSA